MKQHSSASASWRQAWQKALTQSFICLKVCVLDERYQINVFAEGRRQPEGRV